MWIVTRISVVFVSIYSAVPSDLDQIAFKGTLEPRGVKSLAVKRNLSTREGKS